MNGVNWHSIIQSAPRAAARYRLSYSASPSLITINEQRRHATCMPTGYLFFLAEAVHFIAPFVNFVKHFASLLFVHSALFSASTVTLLKN
jgi:hypothetical protein